MKLLCGGTLYYEMKMELLKGSAIPRYVVTICHVFDQ